jgi:hypothetical protein
MHIVVNKLTPSVKAEFAKANGHLNLLLATYLNISRYAQPLRLLSPNFVA